MEYPAVIGRIFFPFFLFFSAFTYGLVAQRFPTMGLQEGFGPGLFPTIITAIIGLFALIEGLRQIAEYRRSKSTEKADWGISLREATNSLIVIFCVVASVLSMPYVGFIPASAALVLVLSIVMGLRPLWKSAAVSLFLAVGLYLIFSEGFGVVFAF